MPFPWGLNNSLPNSQLFFASALLDPNVVLGVLHVGNYPTRADKPWADVFVSNDATRHHPVVLISVEPLARDWSATDYSDRACRSASTQLESLGVEAVGKSHADLNFSTPQGFLEFLGSCFFFSSH